MKIYYKNKNAEKLLIGLNALISAAVAASFVLLYGFDKLLLPINVLYGVHVFALCFFVAEKPLRGLNAVSVRDYLIAIWFEIPLLLALVVTTIGAGRWFARANPDQVRLVAIDVYLVIEVISKVCRSCVNLAATGKNPTQTLIASFLILIFAGAGMLRLPKSASNEPLSFVDALFTATSATCVTGLIVKNTGKDFSLMGQLVILTLIQLGGLGIVIFGAVFALLLGQALSLRESAAMQDLLSAQTLGQIATIIGFIFAGTICIEAIGAVSMFRMWTIVPGRVSNISEQWFFSIFHSISAFCNAGFCLASDSLIGYNKSWEVYGIVCPLIILGGLGFGVLYNLFSVAFDRIRRFIKKLCNPQKTISMQIPQRIQLQTKIVLTVSLVLILAGAAAIRLFENVTGGAGQENNSIAAAFFQSITARTAGFNTINISSMSVSSKFILIILMFIGGSPGSTAGGIKTVTFAVVVMAAYATLRKRNEVELFKRSVRMVIVGRAITITLLFVVMLFGVSLALSITEKAGGFAMSDIIFETGSALGTVGLSTGITPSLTIAGKLLIIATMLIGRLGPLTLLASLAFNLKPARYSYPEEAIVVG
jgi:trk system potassium uptake protein TrkH